MATATKAVHPTINWRGNTNVEAVIQARGGCTRYWTLNHCRWVTHNWCFSIGMITLSYIMNCEADYLTYHIPSKSKLFKEKTQISIKQNQKLTNEMISVIRLRIEMISEAQMWPTMVLHWFPKYVRVSEIEHVLTGFLIYKLVVIAIKIW
jgi:hypothetical protein